MVFHAGLRTSSLHQFEGKIPTGDYLKSTAEKGAKSAVKYTSTLHGKTALAAASTEHARCHLRCPWLERCHTVIFEHGLPSPTGEVETMQRSSRVLNLHRAGSRLWRMILGNDRFHHSTEQCRALDSAFPRIAAVEPSRAGGPKLLQSRIRIWGIKKPEQIQMHSMAA